jgi:N-acetylmuramoyl-L-alanine amidase
VRGLFSRFIKSIVPTARIGRALAASAAILAASGGSTISFAADAAGPMPAVVDVRVAPHPDGTTRIVLDLSRAISYSVQQVEQGFAIDLPQIDWQPKTQALVRPVGLVKSFLFVPADPFSANPRLVLVTAAPSALRKAFLIPPRPDDGNFRLVIDLSPAAPAPPREAASAASEVAGPPAAKPKPRAAAPEIPKQDIKPARKPPPAPPVVVIDPGHGGVDPGTIGLSGIYEKNIVLALALALKAKLDKDGKVVAKLTRGDDTFIPLRDRVAIARANHADLFISLHADSEADSAIHGLSVYTLSQTASDTEAQALADKENKADIVAGLDLSKQSPDVTNILIDLAQRETMNQSASFANLVVDQVDKETHQILPHTHRFAGFAVLKAPDVPSVLVETGYLSNPKDEQMLRRPDYRAKLASALARAVELYFGGARVQRRQ